ncbi:hypothetical protein SH449x_000743 [Pirellulaceae bacterium SH449]
MAPVDMNEIIETINTNADWPETMSLTKAKLFASAVRRYIIFSPKQSSQPGGFGLTIDTVTMKQLLDQAQEFITANDPSLSSFSILGVRHGHR